jgi:hypothetical protein
MAAGRRPYDGLARTAAWFRARGGGRVTRRPPRALLATAILSAVVAALYLAFVGYGYQLEDEGTILYQISTHRGERPYLDFHTGYTPAIFYLNAWPSRRFGVSVVPLRSPRAGEHDRGGDALPARASLAPVAEAAVAALAYAVFMPFFAGSSPPSTSRIRPGTRSPPGC